MNLYMHSKTGSVGTKSEWIESYSEDELLERGVTAESAFEEDENETLFVIGSESDE